MTTDMALDPRDLLTDSHRIALIRRHAGERDIEVEICAESGRAWLIDRAEKDVNQALIGEVLCPNFEPLRGMVRYEALDLLAEIDRLRAALAAALANPGPPDPKIAAPSLPEGDTHG
ncbi:hypothetical protein ACFWYW_57480 [Nonomuraea sp. NPDC059023]|uniref:hypothetical protein n=1 Tax=unclassified Nonomuraea TaxID=2593643 RepID=UPI00369DB4FD